MKAIAGLLFLLLAACGGAPTTVNHVQAAVVVDITGGANQTDTIGRELAPIIARVRDSVTGAPQAGQLVNWVIVSGGGSVFVPATQTDASGQTQELWTLGMVAGDQVLEARAIDPTTGAPLTYTRVHATALPRPTLLLVNQRSAKIVVAVHWYDSAAVLADSVAGSAQHCVVLPTVSDSGYVTYTDYSNNTTGTTLPMHWSASLTFPSSGGQWSMMSPVAPCVP